MTKQETTNQLIMELSSDASRILRNNDCTFLQSEDTIKLIGRIDIVKADEPFDTREQIRVIDKESERLKFVTISNPDYRMPNVVRTISVGAKTELSRNEAMLFYGHDGSLIYNLVSRHTDEGTFAVCYGPVPVQKDGKCFMPCSAEEVIKNFKL